jgi:hypothetical protein
VTGHKPNKAESAANQFQNSKLNVKTTSTLAIRQGYNHVRANGQLQPDEGQLLIGAKAA